MAARLSGSRFEPSLSTTLIKDVAKCSKEALVVVSTPPEDNTSKFCFPKSKPIILPDLKAMFDLQLTPHNHLTPRRQTSGLFLKPFRRHQESTLHLLALPKEIRNRIFDFIALDPRLTDINFEIWRMKGKKAWPLWSVLWTCRQLREEAYLYYFGTMTFRADISTLQTKTYETWICQLNQIFKNGCSALRRLDFACELKLIRRVEEDTESRVGRPRSSYLEIFLVQFTISLRLFNKEPFFSVHTSDVNVHHCPLKGSTESPKQLQERQKLIMDSIVAKHRRQRKENLEANVRDVLLAAPVGSLEEAHIVHLMRLAHEQRYRVFAIQ